MHHTRSSRNHRRNLSLLALIALLFLAIIWALSAGAYEIKALDIFNIFLSKIGMNSIDSAQTIDSIQETIIWKIRTPRTILAIIVGMALASSGTCYQAAFRNPLVEPYILGVSSGAAFGAALAIVFPHTFGQVQIMAFAFALLAVFLAHILAMHNNMRSSVTLVLAGIIIGATFTALVGILQYIADDTALRELTFWTMGALYHATWNDIFTNALVTIPALILIWLSTWKMNVLSLGDEEAQSLGISPTKLRLYILILATLVAAVTVSTVGIIAWVGLMMPHASRFLFGQDNRYVLPASALMGAIYILVCDTLARTITDTEIPIGIITSILGAPYLLWLLRSKGSELYAR